MTGVETGVAEEGGSRQPSNGGDMPTTALEREIRSIGYYVVPWWKLLLFLILGFGTVGAVFLFSWWLPDLRCWLLLHAATSETATRAFVKLRDGRKKICKIVRAHGGPERAVEIRYFVFHSVRFHYKEETKSFRPSPALPANFDSVLRSTSRAFATGLPEGVSDDARAAKQAYYGLNLIVIPRPNFALIFAQQALHPLVVFQYFAVIIWCYEEYYSYSAIVFFITFVTICVNTVTEYRERRRLCEAAHYVTEVEVLKQGVFVKAPSSDIVPGDVVIVSPGKAAFDMVLLNGECVVDETVLTGESVPVRKVAYAVENEADNKNLEANSIMGCTIFGGTTVAVARGMKGQATVGLVCNTGFMTARGNIIRMILHPKVHDVKFIRQAFIFIVLMFIVGLSFYAWDIKEMVKYDALAEDIGVKALDMITVAVPPALPCCLAIATAVVVGRLAKKGIHCLEQARINLAGTLDTVCFDKTGTLTEIGLHLKGFMPALEGKFQQLTSNVAELTAEVSTFFATCHGLTDVHGTPVGDPLDIVLFQASGFSMQVEEGDSSLQLSVKHPDSPERVLKVLKRFDFTSERMRSAAIVQYPDGQLVFHVKGSPERLLGFMKESTVPESYSHVLDQQAQQGLRVIAMATKELGNMTVAEALAAAQDDLEQGSTCLGLVVLVNLLKPTSQPVIEHLHRACINTIMVTGDHVKTAMSVSRQCGILDQSRSVLILDCEPSGKMTFELHDDLNEVVEKMEANPALRSAAEGQVQLAMTGRAFNMIRQEAPDSQLRDVALRHTLVYARMSPEDKKVLVDCLGMGEFIDDGGSKTGLGLKVSFVGDGANDLGALKAAVVGVSLCESEASIAAPLTSTRDDVSCMIDVIAEGRCSLVTCFAIFKFMMVYAFIQVFSLALLYSWGLTVGNWQYLIQDLFYATVTCAVMAMTHPYPTISKRQPITSLLSFEVLLPVLAQFGLVAGFQVFANEMLKQQDWFVPYQFDYDYVLGISVAQQQPQCGVLFIMGVAQLMIASAVFNVGKPWRKASWTNLWLVICVLGQLGFLLYMIWAPGDIFLRNGPAVAAGKDAAYTPIAPPPFDSPPPLPESTDDSSAPAEEEDEPFVQTWTFLESRPLSWRVELFGIICANVCAAFIVDYAIKFMLMYGQKTLQEAGLLRGCFGSCFSAKPQVVGVPSWRSKSMAREMREKSMGGVSDGVSGRGVSTVALLKPKGKTKSDGALNEGSVQVEV